MGVEHHRRTRFALERDAVLVLALNLEDLYLDLGIIVHAMLALVSLILFVGDLLGIEVQLPVRI